MMSNFDNFSEMISAYLKINAVNIDYISNLKDCSLNDSKNEASKFLCEKEVFSDIKVINMDVIAQQAYKNPLDAKIKAINTVDSFLINNKNEWFLIEFKDSPITSKTTPIKNKIVKKAYANWYMILDILYKMRNSSFKYEKFNYDNPTEFSKLHVTYILVCSFDKNPSMYKQIKNSHLQNEKYTPPFMEPLKGYLFKDVYAYTELDLEMKFISKLRY